ncbi:cytochrome c peroxidase [Salegentibacter sp. F188]|uniref:Cytochrome c peroxidase n=1 Tax=Autumnicola patrickiae TaxID=3075591 RepID=A0ABU3DWR0_9FLAO|nr:cytochrome c peroxidase [Salegentibacter sp. F188]MDT0688155.1 cytochrome c peroxidase [Salegentibacter sp. F188]
MINSNKLFLLLLYILINFSCKHNEEYVDLSINEEQATEIVNWENPREFYLESIEKSIAHLEEVKKIGQNDEKSKEVFELARAEFKKAEPYASYLNPPVGHRVNGPALPVFLEDNSRTMPPVGLQKIEESIYESGVSEREFMAEVEVTQGLMNNLKENILKRELNPQRFFVATHQQLLRIVSLSISGFDTPVSHLGFDETIISLRSLLEVYDRSISGIIKEKNKELDQSFQQRISEAIGFIEKDKDFENFDRYTFIRDYMNPVTSSWVAIRKESGLWDGNISSPFNFDAPTFFEEDSFNEDFFMPAMNRNSSEKQVALGEKLFFDKNLSEDKKMSCATCHVPEKAYADGMVTNLDNQGNKLQRNTPTLINVAFQQSFFWDGRSENLMDQISSVFTNDKEFNTGVHQFSEDILEDPAYKEMIRDAFGQISGRNTDVIKALSAYIANLNGFNSKFDRNIRGEEDSFTAEEKHGFNLFMGKALCATCHFVPLTNGTVPPFFNETEKEVIGVPETAQNLNLDDDFGFYWMYGVEIQKGMFKTPTVRNSAVTAPYMHNGVYETLEEVIDFYNSGGGAGLGFDLPHQTLPFDELSLNEREKQALIAYLKTLTDTEVSESKKEKLLVNN